MDKTAKSRRILILYLIITILLTWLLQFMPMILGLDIENTSISSFDFASLFFGIGGVMPTLTGVIFVLVFYTKDGIKDYLKRCFVPNKGSLIAILLSLGLICAEVFVTQMISRGLGAAKLGFEGLKLIAKNPLYFFYFLFWGIISGPFSGESSPDRFQKNSDGEVSSQTACSGKKSCCRYRCLSDLYGVSGTFRCTSIRHRSSMTGL